ncbi:hypothetical protein LTR95_007233 [Oleoguttula sp. CCFEE 5521]
MADEQQNDTTGNISPISGTQDARSSASVPTDDFARSVSPIDDPMDIDDIAEPSQDADPEPKSAFSSSSEEDNKENADDSEDHSAWLRDWQAGTPERPSAAGDQQTVAENGSSDPVSNVPHIPADYTRTGEDGSVTHFQHRFEDGVVKLQRTWRGPGYESRIIDSYQDAEGSHEYEQLVTEERQRREIRRTTSANGRYTNEQTTWTTMGSSPDEVISYVENRSLDGGELTGRVTTWTDLTGIEHEQAWHPPNGEEIETFTDLAGGEHEIRRHYQDGRWWTTEQWRDRLDRERVRTDTVRREFMMTGSVNAEGTMEFAAVTGQPDSMGDYDHLQRADGSPLHPHRRRDRVIRDALKEKFGLRTVPHTTVEPSPLQQIRTEFSPDPSPDPSPESSPETSPESSSESSPEPSPTQGPASAASGPSPEAPESAAGTPASTSLASGSSNAAEGPSAPESASGGPASGPSSPISPAYRTNFAWDEEEPSEHDNALFAQSVAALAAASPTTSNDQTDDDEDKAGDTAGALGGEAPDEANPDEPADSDEEGSAPKPSKKASSRSSRGDRYSEAQQASKKARNVRRKARRAAEGAAKSGGSDPDPPASEKAGSKTDQTDQGTSEGPPDNAEDAMDESDSPATAVTEPQSDIVSPTNSDDIEGPDLLMGRTASKGLQAANDYTARAGSATGQERLDMNRARIQDKTLFRNNDVVPSARYPGTPIDYQARSELLGANVGRYRHLRNQALYRANAREAYNQEQREQIHALEVQIDDLRSRVRRAEQEANDYGGVSIVEMRAQIATLQATVDGHAAETNMLADEFDKVVAERDEAQAQLERRSDATVDRGVQTNDASTAAAAAISGPTYASADTQTDDAADVDKSSATATTSAGTQTNITQEPGVLEECKKRCEDLAAELKIARQDTGVSLRSLMGILQVANANKRAALADVERVTTELSRLQAQVESDRQAAAQTQQALAQQTATDHVAVADAIQSAMQAAEVRRLQRQSANRQGHVERRVEYGIAERYTRTVAELEEIIDDREEVIKDLRKTVTNRFSANENCEQKCVKLQAEVDRLSTEISSAQEVFAEQLQQATSNQTELERALGRPTSTHRFLYNGECKKCAYLKLDLAEERKRVEMAQANRKVAWQQVKELQGELLAAAGKGGACVACKNSLEAARSRVTELEAQLDDVRRDLDLAVLERDVANAERDAAVAERDAAIKLRDDAYIELDNLRRDTTRNNRDTDAALIRQLEEQRLQHQAEVAAAAAELEAERELTFKHAKVAEKLGREKHVTKLENEEQAREIEDKDQQIKELLTESPRTADLRAARQRTRELEDRLQAQVDEVNELRQALLDARARPTTPAATPASSDLNATPRARPSRDYQASPALAARQHQAQIRRNADAAARNTRLQKILVDFEYVPREKRFLHLNL